MANSGVGEPDRWLARAEETLGAAKALAEREFYKDSVYRVYYAMSYAAKASVVSEGVRVKKHSAVVAAFGRLLRNPGGWTLGCTLRSWMLLNSEKTLITCWG